MSGVCGTDFTEHAAGAASAAAAIAAHEGQLLTLVHVCEPEARGGLPEDVRAALTGNLDAEADRVRSLGVAVTTELLRLRTVLSDAVRREWEFRRTWYQCRLKSTAVSSQDDANLETDLASALEMS